MDPREQGRRKRSAVDDRSDAVSGGASAAREGGKRSHARAGGGAGARAGTAAGLRGRRVLLAPATLAALAALALAGCSPPSRFDGPRLVLLYATCTLNKDFLQPYRSELPFTPSLARFAGESRVFERHMTESGSSGTAFASLFSGAQADRHGVFKHPRRLEDDLSLVFEVFRDAGYDTYYWSQHEMAAPKYNYHQGVERDGVVPGLLRADHPRLSGILERLERDPSYRVLIVTAFSVTHGPYSLDHLDAYLSRHPERARGLGAREIRHFHGRYVKHYVPLQTRFEETVAEQGWSAREVDRLARSLEVVYESRVAALDDLFGEVIERLDAEGPGPSEGGTLVAFTADHGETLYDPSRPFQWTHGPDLPPEVIEVPLLVRGPGLAPGRVEEVSRSIDVFPTLAGLAGVPLPEGAPVDGVDLSPALRGEAAWPVEAADSHGTLRVWKYHSPDVISNIWAARRQGPWLFRWARAGDAWEFGAFDLERSRDLSVNGFDPDSREHVEAAEALWAYRERMIRSYLAENPEEASSMEEELESLDQEARDALESLGYLR